MMLKCLIHLDINYEHGFIHTGKTAYAYRFYVQGCSFFKMPGDFPAVFKCWYISWCWWESEKMHATADIQNKEVTGVLRVCRFTLGSSTKLSLNVTLKLCRGMSLGQAGLNVTLLMSWMYFNHDWRCWDLHWFYL